MAFPNEQSQIIGVIPARWGSTRFPGKMLHPVLGKPLVQHAWERCCQAQELAAVVIATDDARIAETARGFGAEVVMTADSHPSGTDRCAEAVTHFVAASGRPVTHAINIQGDEPLVDPDLIDQLARALVDDPALPMVTAASPLAAAEDPTDPNIVKIAADSTGRALYFSRAPIPFSRDGARPSPLLRHHGIYGFQLAYLRHLVSLPPSPLEQTECLEQLRALEDGATIQVVVTDHCAPGVDTLEGVAAVEELLQKLTL